MRLSLALATALLASLVASIPGTAVAQQLDLRVVDTSGGKGQRTLPGLRGPRIDFGDVTNHGPEPRAGRRVQAEGGAYYVATIELEVVAVESPLQSLRKPLHRARKPALLPTRRPLVTPRGDLYASVTDGNVDGSDVRLSLDPGSFSEQAAIVLTPQPLPVISGLAPGDRIRFDLGMFASDRTQGPREASVHFEVR